MWLCANDVDAEGGSEVVADGHVHVKSFGPLLPSQTYISKPDRLSCKAATHAVSPAWRGGQLNEENILYPAALQSMPDAFEGSFQQIAIPTTSAGIFDLPVNRATENNLSASCDYLTEQNDTCLREAHVVDNDPQVMSRFETSLNSMTLPSRPGSEEGHSQTGVRRVTVQMNAELAGNTSGEL